jgi:hypothetical protein
MVGFIGEIEKDKTMLEILNNYQEQLIQVAKSDEIPANQYMVYIFGMNGTAVVVGHGQKNRAKVILDNQDHLTPNHIKSLHVRCCVMHGQGPFEKMIIPCDSKASARQTELEIQALLGGNVLQLPPQVKEKLFEDIEPGSMTDTVLRMAMASSFSAIADLLKWARLGLLTQDVKDVLSRKLAINLI